LRRVSGKLGLGRKDSIKSTVKEEEGGKGTSGKESKVPGVSASCRKNDEVKDSQLNNITPTVTPTLSRRLAQILSAPINIGQQERFAL
jgi:hypothetical protein